MAQQGVAGIRVMDCAQNKAVVLDDSRLFFGTGYKVLRSQRPSSLVPCCRASLNGSVELVYFTHDYVALSQFAQDSSVEATCRVLVSLVDAVADIRKNGFLSDRNLLIDTAAIFVDPATESARLLYLPLTAPVAGSNDMQVGRRVYDVCQDAVALASGNEMFSMPHVASAYEWGNLDSLRTELQGLSRRATTTSRSDAERTRTYRPTDPGTTGTGASAITGAATERSSGSLAGATYLLTAYDGSHQTAVVRVSGEHVVVGSSEERADCVVKLSTAVSRAHCELTVLPDGRLTVSDLGSLNGTWVNGRRIEPHVSVALGPGSTLKLADVTFLVSLARG